MSSAGNNGVMRRGRPQSIPLRAFESVFEWHSMGHGSRGIVRMLENQGVYSTKSSVSRLLLRQGTYVDLF